LLRALLVVDQWSDDDTVVSQLLAAARPAQGDRVDTLVAALEEQRRLRLILGWRQRVHDPALRFLLALLLNVHDRDEILRMVTEWSGVEATAQLVAWIRQLCESDQSRILAPLDDGSARILEGLLRGHSKEQIVDALRSEFDDADVEASRPQIDDAIALFQSSILLRPLLAVRP
jgi:hypothetical protein